MNAKILYIEDDELSLYLVTFLLNAKGYEVIQARDAEEGIEKAGRCKPDLILLDIHLPLTDGYVVSRILRNNPDLVDIPILALTSFAMAGDRMKALEAGCNGFIEKPIDPETFPKQVGQYLAKSVSRRSEE